MKTISDMSESEKNTLRYIGTPSVQPSVYDRMQEEKNGQCGENTTDVDVHRDCGSGTVPINCSISDDSILKEEDPNGVGQHEPGAKLDSGKPDCSLLGYFGKALLEVSRVGTVGAQKYTRGGWQHVDQGFDRYTAAMLRHYFAEHSEKRDPDTGMLHEAQVAWNALARLELKLRGLSENIKELKDG